MCGIFMMLNNDSGSGSGSDTGGIDSGSDNGAIAVSKEFVSDQFKLGSRRGPESSKLIVLNSQTTVGFHRLAINGQDEESMQPLWLNNKMLICNGEIYNYKDLFLKLNAIPTTKSDCEIILHLYCRVGIEQTLRMLDGVFAFCLYDADLNKIFVARDPYGVRPLYEWRGPNGMLIFASELKMISKFRESANNNGQLNEDVEQFPPGHYVEIVRHTLPSYDGLWTQYSNRIQYHSCGSIAPFCKAISMPEQIVYHLRMAVLKRCLNTDRPIACLLSGGLDSSIITALVKEHYDYYYPDKQLETYSIGLAGSEDLKYARIVADHLGTLHTEVVITEDDFFNAIPEVIRAIESYDTTTVRASIGNYLIGKYISENSQAKVIFNGDGADELCGGYLYMRNAPDAIEFDKETKRLLTDIYLFDVLRSDKSISSNGLEPRTPFLDKTFVQYYLSIPIEDRYDAGNNKRCEKYLIRDAFSTVYHADAAKPFLPDKILWRPKEAFSDGVSSQDRSLYTILQEKIGLIPDIREKHTNDWFGGYKDSHIPPKTIEQYYYRRIFDTIYPDNASIVPYLWMPKYTNATDPSARTLTALYTHTM